MLAKVSTFIGPNSVFSTTTGTPSLVLSLDAAGYTSSGVWFDLSTFNNHGISDGSVSWSSDGGGSFEFDGFCPSGCCSNIFVKNRYVIYYKLPN